MNGRTIARNKALTVAATQRAVRFENSTCFRGRKSNLFIDLRRPGERPRGRAEGAATRNSEIPSTRIFNNTLSVRASIRAHSVRLQRVTAETQTPELGARSATPQGANDQRTFSFFQS